jgi:Flp pilus assembly protein TadG
VNQAPLPGSGREGRSRGQGLVEFALVFPVIALLLFGVLDLGRAVFAYNTIANAARQGARVAIVNQILISPDCAVSKPVEDPNNPHWSIKTCAANAATSLGVTAADVSVTYSKPAGTALVCAPLNVGCIATVTVRYSYSPMTPIFSSIFPSMAMNSTSQMPVERVFP